MREIKFAKIYQKDLHLARRRKLPENELNDVIQKLAKDEPLEIKHRDHALQGKYNGYRECHIRPNWLLIYKKEDNNVVKLLLLVRTGTHSDLF